MYEMEREKVILVHGGPGLSFDYLKAPFEFLSDRFSLSFHQQSLKDWNSTESVIDFLCRDLDFFCQSQSPEKPFHLIAHSWGALLVYSALKTGFLKKLDRCLLVSPIGLTKKDFDASGERLFSKVSESDMEVLEKYQAADDGAGFMSAATKYYVASGTNDINLGITKYSFDEYEKTIDALPDYDFSQVSIFSNFAGRILSIYGDNDIETPSEMAEIVPGVSTEIIPRCGHFAFAERPDEFQPIVSRFLS